MSDDCFCCIGDGTMKRLYTETMGLFAGMSPLSHLEVDIWLSVSHSPGSCIRCQNLETGTKVKNSEVAESDFQVVEGQIMTDNLTPKPLGEMFNFSISTWK